MQKKSGDVFYNNKVQFFCRAKFFLSLLGWATVVYALPFPSKLTVIWLKKILRHNLYFSEYN